jgi:hypothetical protein
MTSTSQSTPIGDSRPDLSGPVLHDLAAESTPGVAALDARWAGVVLAGQSLDYAVSPRPAEALADVLRMVGLTSAPADGGIRFGVQGA